MKKKKGHCGPVSDITGGKGDCPRWNDGHRITDSTNPLDTINWTLIPNA